MSDVAEGGETHFPDAVAPQPPPAPALARTRMPAWHGKTDCGGAQRPPAPPMQGVSIVPSAGRAAIFWSALPGGLPDECCAHAARPVQAGEKWIATCWFTEAGGDG